MRSTVLLAVPHAWETRVVAAIDACPGLELARRCADLPELLSTAAAGLGDGAVIGAGLAGLDRTAVAELTRCGVRVVGVVRPGDEGEDRTLRGLGIEAVLPADAAPERLQAVLRGEADPELQAWVVGVDGGGPAGSGSDRVATAASDPGGPSDESGRTAGPADPAHGGEEPGGWRPRDSNDLPTPWPGAGEPESPVVDAGDDDAAAGHPSGTVVAVWGPAGAPGRSSVALALASEAARCGVAALLVDADPYGGVQAQALALLDEAPGLAGAVRSADQGALDAAGLARRCLRVAPGLSLLTGISRADRWPELRPDPLETVLGLARLIADIVVVDCGFCLEDDEELSYDTTAPRRNAATLTALACADQLVIVGAGEPVGLLRLVRGLQELGTVRTPQRRTVVVNRIRPSAVGPRPQESVAAALHRFAGVTDVRFVPDDREAFDRAALQGRTLAESAPESPARAALAGLAAELLGLRPPGARSARRRRARLRRRAIRG